MPVPYRYNISGGVVLDILKNIVDAAGSAWSVAYLI